jgi:hypothetical protein
MPTIFSRLKFLCVKPDQATKMKIGKEVCDLYFAQEKKPRIFKIESEEPEGTFKVLSYPKKFTPTMDKVILKYAMPKQKRPRSNMVFSTKQNKNGNA